MKIKIKSRFYVFLGFILLSAGFILYSRMGSSAVQKTQTSVLAAADADLNTYSLVEPEDSPLGNKIHNDIAKYEPLNISHTVQEGDTLDTIA